MLQVTFELVDKYGGPDGGKGTFSVGNSMNFTLTTGREIMETSLFRRVLCLLMVAALLVPTTSSEKQYSNSWAVLVEEGPIAAKELARKYGFIDHGQVYTQLINSLERVWDVSLVRSVTNPPISLDQN